MKITEDGAIEYDTAPVAYDAMMARRELYALRWERGQETELFRIDLTEFPNVPFFAH